MSERVESPPRHGKAGHRTEQGPGAGIDEAAIADADALTREVIRLVRLIERTRAHFSSVRRDGIEHAAYVLLARLVAGGPQRAGALADAVHSDPSTISRQVSALVRLGLVERRPDPEDGRACLLAATAEGGRVFESHRRVRTEHTAAMLAHWSPRERRQLVRLLARFNTDFEEYRPRIVGAVGEPAVGEPAVGEPAVGEPAVGEPAIGEPAVGEPAVGESPAPARRPGPAA